MNDKYLDTPGVAALWSKTKAYTDSKTAAGLFTLEMDTSGNLYAVYPDGTVPPKFEYDNVTGDLYYVI